jgi:hypothetical protein
MNFYASKSFFDPVGAGRRIYWGWALVPPASTQTLPRVTTYHAALKRLIFTPAPELSALRGAVLFSQPTVPLAANSSAPLSAGWAPGAGNTSEVAVSFALPASRATFGLRVRGSRAVSCTRAPREASTRANHPTTPPPPNLAGHRRVRAHVYLGPHQPHRHRGVAHD